MDKSTKAKYFCENCGSEVAANARCCPKCGKFFSSVRCPSCGHMGTVHDFKNGCPSCHYAMSEAEINGTDEGGSGTLDGRKHKLSSKSKRKIKKAFNSYDSRSIGEDTPAWLFVASIIVLIGVIAMIIYRCQ